MIRDNANLSQRSMNSGFSINFLNSWLHIAATAPSTTLWSELKVTFKTWPTLLQTMMPIRNSLLIHGLRILGGFIYEHSLFSGTHWQNASLTRVNYGLEVGDTEIAEVGYWESGSFQFLRLKFVFFSSLGQILKFASNLFNTLMVGFLNDRSDQAFISLNSHAHVNILVFSDELSHPGGVGFGNSHTCHSCCLDHHVIDCDLGLSHSVHFRSQIYHGVYCHWWCHIVMRDVLFRECLSFSQRHPHLLYFHCFCFHCWLYFWLGRFSYVFYISFEDPIIGAGAFHSGQVYAHFSSQLFGQRWSEYSPTYSLSHWFLRCHFFFLRLWLHWLSLLFSWLLSGGGTSRRLVILELGHIFLVLHENGNYGAEFDVFRSFRI